MATHIRYVYPARGASALRQEMSDALAVGVVAERKVGVKIANMCRRSYYSSAADPRDPPVTDALLGLVRWDCINNRSCC